MKSSTASDTRRTINIGIVGATGVVGETFLLLLVEREFPVGDLRLFASDASKGLTKRFQEREIKIQMLTPGCFRDLDIVFFSSGDDVSREWAPQAVKDGAIAIDNSAAFRLQEGVSLAVPEINSELLPRLRLGNPPGEAAQIIANPNCSTIQLSVALNPLRKQYGLECVRVASYQAASGAGKNGVEELVGQTKTALEGETPQRGSTFPKPLAFDSIPQIGSFAEEGSAHDGLCTEEIKIISETRKILGLPELKVSAFTVRVPALNSHAEAVWVTLKEPAKNRQEVETTLSSSPGIELFRRESGDYPTQALASGTDPVYVGRVHQDPADPQTWILWVVSDNLRKGAALNGIQIAEKLYDL